MGRFWDGHRLLIGIEEVEIFLRWESAVFSVERENGAGLAGRTGTEERFQVAGTGVSYVTGWSGERSGAGGMFTND